MKTFWGAALFSFFMFSSGISAEMMDGIKVKAWDAGEGKRVVNLFARPGARQRILVLTPDGKAKAAVVLFAGGNGNVRILKDGSIRNGNNFLVRTRETFVSHGLTAAVFDKPSDRDTLKENRTEDWHVTDVAAVVMYLKKTYRLPVWLVGTSRGTMTVGHAGAKLTSEIAGVVFTSSMNEAAALDIGRITVPALITHHKQDECHVTTPAAATDIAKRLVKAPKVEVMWFTGGRSPGRECGPKAYHGYLGIEDDVVGRIAGFIAANTH
ncbi:MAG: alpha/beta hydrolase [Alphaproteobacteria bacterium]